MKKSTEVFNKVEELKKFKENLISNRIKARKKLAVLEKELEELNSEYISSDNTKDEELKFKQLKNKHIEIASVKQIGEYKLYDTLKEKMDEASANLDALFAKAEPEYNKYKDQITKEIKAKEEEQEKVRKEIQQEIDTLQLKLREHKYKKALAMRNSLIGEMRILSRKEKYNG
jgi:vacuolar-type H+-ATPase subunit H